MKITSKKIMGTHRLSMREKNHTPGQPPKVTTSGADGVRIEFGMDGCLFRLDLDHRSAATLLGGLGWGVHCGLEHALEDLEKKKKENS